MTFNINKKILLIAAITTLLFINFPFLHPIKGNDTWFHLLSGQEIFNNKVITKTDSHSYTNPNSSYINQSWLAQLFLFIIYNLAGFNGLQIFHLTIIFSTFLLLIFINGKKNIFLSLACLVFVLPFAIIHDEIRPYLFTWFLSALTIFLIYKKIYYPIPLIFVFWPNIHNGFILALYVLVLHATQNFLITKNKKLLTISLISILATFINPYGPLIYLYPLSIGNSPQLINNIEWQPLKPNSLFFWIYFIFTSSLLFLFIKRKKYRQNLLEFILIISLSIFGFLSMRNPIIVTILLFPIFFKYLSEIIKPQHYLLICLSSYLVLISMSFFLKKTDNIKGFGIDYTQVPIYALDFIKNQHFSGNIFNDYDFGGYFIWKDHDLKVFIDGRQEIYNKQTTLDYVSIINGFENWKNLVKKYNISYFVVRPERGLNNQLINNPDWDLVYFDYNSKIYIKKNDHSNLPRLTDISLWPYLKPQDQKNINQELEYLLTQNPNFFGANKILALNYFQERNYPKVKYHLKQYLLLSPKAKKDPDLLKIRQLLNID